MFLVVDRATHALLLFAITNRPPQLARLGVPLQPLKTDTTAVRHDFSGPEVPPFREEASVRGGPWWHGELLVPSRDEFIPDPRAS